MDDDVLAREDAEVEHAVERELARADAGRVGEVDAEALGHLRAGGLVGAHADAGDFGAVDGVEQRRLARVAEAGKRDLRLLRESFLHVGHDFVDAVERNGASNHGPLSKHAGGP